MVIRPNVYKRYSHFSVLFALFFLSVPIKGYAVVGQAERYSEFEERDLREFHATLASEETSIFASSFEGRDDQKDPTSQVIQPGDVMTPEKETEEMKLLREELLAIRDRDRVRFGLTGDYTYDSNVNRNVPRSEKGDSLFNTTGFMELDFSGKKTDLRTESRFGKSWNIVFSENDFLSLEQRIRYRRKYFRKTSHSLQTSLLRHSSKTVEIDSQKVRYDANVQTSINHSLTRRLSWNTDLNFIKRMFVDEAFDQDSNWQFIAAPSAFWNFSPKSRISLGYRFGASRIRTKSGDTNAHDIRIGYFGKVTKKSSASVDLSYSHQTPRSTDTAEVNTVTVGLGYIFQYSPKTQFSIQAIRSLQNSTSNLVSGTEDTTTKQDTHFTNDSISVSMNNTLTKKIISTMSINVSHLRTKTFKEGDEDIETRQFTFPFNWNISYAIHRWMRMNLSYQFAFRTGNEKTDTFRAHIWKASLTMTF